MSKYVMHPEANEGMKITIGGVLIPRTGAGVTLSDAEAAILLTEGSIVKVSAKDAPEAPAPKHEAKPVAKTAPKPVAKPKVTKTAKKK